MRESNTSIEECLPAALRGPGTTLTPMRARASGAAVYRVESGGGAFILKIGDETDSPTAWRRKRDVQQHAADAGIAPKVVHVDEARRAVVSALVPDRSFAAFYMDPRTHETAIARLGSTLRRVHQL